MSSNSTADLDLIESFFQSNEFDNEDEEDNRPTEEQQFTFDKKAALVPVEVTCIVQPNKMILKMNKVELSSTMDISISLGTIFYEFQGQSELQKRRIVWKRKMHVIANTTISSSQLDYKIESDDEYLPSDIEFHRGIILREIDNEEEKQTLSVFLYDLGVIKDLTMFNLAPLLPKSCKIDEFPPSFVIIQIPGLVPRARESKLEKLIPGMKSYVRQARTWSTNARKDVENWLVNNNTILLRILIVVAEKCLFYGDLYGANKDKVQEHSLSKYLLDQENCFISSTFLKQIYTKDGGELH